MTKYLGQGCGKDIGGIPCGDFIEEGVNEDNIEFGNYYYCDECIKEKVEKIMSEESQEFDQQLKDECEEYKEK